MEKHFYFKINGTYILGYMCFVHTQISIYTYYAILLYVLLINGYHANDKIIVL